jgi:hypothetical protein
MMRLPNSLSLSSRPFPPLLKLDRLVPRSLQVLTCSLPSPLISIPCSTHCRPLTYRRRPHPACLLVQSTDIVARDIVRARMETQVANLAIRKAADLSKKDQDCVKATINLDKGTKVDNCGTWKQVPTLALRSTWSRALWRGTRGGRGPRCL